MENFKEFQGKDLDECIEQSCSYFDCPREKLEIEIIQDAKSGIFGIVGARKAKIRVRKANIAENVHNLIGDGAKPEKSNQQTGRSRPHNKGGNGVQAHKGSFPNKNHKHPKNTAPAANGEDLEEAAQPPAAQPDTSPSGASEPEIRANAGDDKDQGASHKWSPRKHGSRENAPADFDNIGEDGDFEDGYQVRALEELDLTALEALTREALGRLLTPLAGREISMSVEFARGQIRANVDWEGDAGLLIGREGQTLQAVQYVASRIISKAMNAALRVQLDIGDYRRRQEEKLCEIAHSLAEKARQTGRSFSTRPLSSYHRRIIHLCLREDTEIITRSSGEGPLKRVLILPKKAPGRS